MSNFLHQVADPLILTRLGTCDLYANAQITAEQIFKILILKFLANFFK